MLSVDNYRLRRAVVTAVTFYGAVLLALLAATSPLAADAFKVDLKCLVIVNQAYANGVSDAGRVFQSTGIRYEELVVPPTGVSSLSLTVAGDDAHGKYSCIVKGPTSYSVNGAWTDVFTQANYDQLTAYAVKFSVRQVILESWPDGVPGMASYALSDPTTGIPPAGTTATLVATNYAKAIPKSILNPAVTFSLEQNQYQWGVYTIGAYIKNATLTTLTPLVKLSKTGPGGVPLYAMVVETDCTKQWEKLHLFVSTRGMDPSSVSMSYIWQEWVTKNMYLGKRRIFFSPQIDDVFLSTETWENQAVTNRINPTDIDSIITWSGLLRPKLPAGSDVRLEFGVNGMGVATLTRVDQDAWNNALVLNYTEETPYNGWKRPLDGSGMNFWDMLPGQRLQRLHGGRGDDVEV